MRHAPSRIGGGERVGALAAEDPLVDLHHLLEQRRVAAHLVLQLDAAQRRRGPEGHGLGAQQVLVGEGVEGHAAGDEHPHHVPLEEERKRHPRAQGRRARERQRPLRLGVAHAHRPALLAAPRRGGGRRGARPRGRPPRAPRTAATRRPAPGSATATREKSACTTRPSCFSTSSSASSGRTEPWMASRAPRSCSAFWRRSRSRSTVKEGSSPRRSRAIASRRASMTSCRSPSSRPAAPSMAASRPSTSRSRRSMFNSA